MEEIAIRINSLSKIYKLYDRPIDRLKETLSPSHKSYHKDFYALNNINLTIKKGETVGVIGKNGAGKSTLLKIITGVLSPSAGSVEINGRISSLLELGAGFNPEYTGIENIYLNGTIMGLSKEETDARLDDILAFADIGDFVHQPVKTYSSGMYVRLAFSVAINVKPDILIVDEALAVGDARFQLKCLAKLKELKEQGVTILLVSHSIEMLKSFTDKAVLLDEGKFLKEGDPVEIGLEYYRLLFGNNVTEGKTEKNISAKETTSKDDFVISTDQEKSYGSGGAFIEKIIVKGLKEGQAFYPDDELEIILYCGLKRDRLNEILLTSSVKPELMFGLRIENQAKIVITDLASSVLGKIIPIWSGGKYIIKYRLKIPHIASGDYWFSPEIAMGVQDNLIPLCEYVYLFKLICLNPKQVLGVMRFDYDMEIKGD